MRKITSTILLLTLFGAGCANEPAPTPPPASIKEASQIETHSNPVTSPTMLSKPALTINKNKTYTAVLMTTAGTIAIELNAQQTPITVNNLVYLARNNFYNNTPFHRVIRGFMIQGGDPKGDGTGGPGYQFNDESFTGTYSRGTVAMANAGPNTNGSQFFIMHGDYPLPPNYVIFGHVISGLEVVDKIATAPVTQSATGEPSKPLSPVLVQSMEIVEK